MSEYLGIRKTPKFTKKDVESLNSLRSSVSSLYFLMNNEVNTKLGTVIRLDAVARLKDHEERVLNSYFDTCGVAASVLRQVTQAYGWSYTIDCDDDNKVFYVSVNLTDAKNIGSRHASFIRALDYVVDLFYQNVRYLEKKEDEDSRHHRL